MLKQLDENGNVVRDKVRVAIDRLKAFEPRGGYYLAFSGGKDSQCIYHLAKMAGVEFDAHYNVTSVDPPELVRFIKDNYPDVSIDIPKDKDGKQISMWSLIANHTIPPTRVARYCCSDLKETHGKNRVTVTGVRWAESARRKKLHGVANIQTKSKKLIGKALEENPSAAVNDRGTLIMNDDNSESRRMVEQCYRTKKTLVNPIVDWTDEDVWEFLNDVAKVPHCSLYDEGFTRLGCIGCPLAGEKSMRKEFERWPKYKNLYILAMEKMIKNHPNEIRILESDEASADDTPPSGCSRAGSNGAEAGGSTIRSTEIVRVVDHRRQAEMMFEWWMWMCRSASKADRARPNPIKIIREAEG